MEVKCLEITLKLLATNSSSRIGAPLSCHSISNTSISTNKLLSFNFCSISYSAPSQSIYKTFFCSGCLANKSGRTSLTFLILISIAEALFLSITKLDSNRIPQLPLACEFYNTFSTRVEPPKPKLKASILLEYLGFNPKLYSA